MRLWTGSMALMSVLAVGCADAKDGDDVDTGSEDLDNTSSDDNTDGDDDVDTGEPEDTAGEAGHGFDAGELDGRAYLLDMSTGVWTAPGAIGPLIAASFTELPILGVVDQSADELGVVFGYRSTEDDCIDIPAADFSGNPAFVSPAADVSFGLSSSLVIVEDFSIAGEFSEDGSQIVNGQMTAVADIRRMVDMLAPMAGSADPYEICGMLDALLAPCASCSDGEPFCLDLAVEGIVATATEPLACMRGAH